MTKCHFGREVSLVQTAASIKNENLISRDGAVW